MFQKLDLLLSSGILPDNRKSPFSKMLSVQMFETINMFIVIHDHWKYLFTLTFTSSGFGGLEVACWPLVPKFAGSHLAEAVGFLGRKNPQHAFLRRGSKAIGPML